MILIVVEFEIVFVVLVLIVDFICFGVEMLNFRSVGVVLCLFSCLISFDVGILVVVLVFVMLVFFNK